MYIDPFGQHNKMDKHLETVETIPFTPGGSINPNKKHCLGEKVKGLNSSKNTLKGCIESCLKKQAKPQKHFISMILKSEMENCTTETTASP